MFICGDLHKQHHIILVFVETHKIRDATFIQVGDFGIGFQSYEKDLADLLKLNNYLVSVSCILLIVRGNHENPYFWNNDYNLSNITFVKELV